MKPARAATRQSVSAAAPITVIAALIVFTMSTDLYLPTFPALAEALSTTPSMVQLSLTLNLLAYALAALVHGPLADRFGRRHVLSAGLAFFVLASVLCMLAPTITWLLTGRIAQGLAASTGSVLTALILRELFDDAQAQRWISAMAIAVGFGPAIGPLVGALVAESFSWRANFALLAAMAAIGLVAVLCFVPETKPVDHERLSLRKLTTRYGYVLRNRMFQRYQLINAFSLAGLFSFLTAAPFVFIGTFGLTATGYSALHGGLVALYVFAAAANGVLAGRVEAVLMIRFALLIGTIAVMILALGSLRSEPWLTAIVLGMSVGSSAMGLLMANAWLMLLNAVEPAERGTASSVSSLTQMLTAATASLVVAMLPAGSVSAMSFVLGLCLVGCLLAFGLLGRRCHSTAGD